MKETIQKLFRNETFIAVLLIFFTTILTYGINIPGLGYYFDDWYVLWSGQSRGAESFIPLFNTDRPFIGVVYSIIYRFLGDKIINWHLYALLWRFIGGIAFFWILRLLWPKSKYITTLMSVLFMVYPGFLSQPDAATKQNHLYGFGTALLSIAFMLQGLKSNSKIGKIIFSLLSVISAANYLLIYEYMIGLEGMRLVLLGYALFQEGYKKIRPLILELLKQWWPYPIVSVGFLYWRFFIFEGSRTATDATRLAKNYFGDIRHMSVRLAFETAKDFLDTSIFAWFVKPYLLFSETPYTNLGRALLIAVVVIAFVLLYSFLYRKYWEANHEEEDTSGLTKSFILIGAFIIICAVFPVIISGRQLDLFDAYKSYGLHPIGGVILFVAGIILMLQPKFRNLILLFLIGISVSTQTLNADYWKQFWTYQREVWWQLSWRAPDIKDDTLVMTYLFSGYRLQQDYEIFGPVNLIYRPYRTESPLIQAEVLNEDTAYDVLRVNIRTNPVRDIKIKRDFNNLLLITIPSPLSCMHVIDGSLPVYSQYEDLLVQQVGEYSKVDRIISSSSSHKPPSQIFGPEPSHNWCYYYQKASLARQFGNWDEISELYDQVLTLDLEPNDESEIIPFFEGLVNVGRYDDARVVFNNTIKGRQKLRFPLCTTLENDPEYHPEFHYDYEKIFEILCNS